ncbi:cytochrome P450 [Calocera viscosa TUFC12733]|uniref:Cytochrome P450 n=1 Tax=Calocera viscosa (strain TUFC12733) TaxID=1330018 RepID=A0A167JHJ4_CALVF|nr:cytochrome P450 [Calocera viscosa TUFC12733]
MYSFSLLSWPIALAGILLVLAIDRILAYYRGLALVSYLPGERYFFSPVSIPGAILPTSKWNPGNLWMWSGRGRVYKRKGGSEIESCLGWLGGMPLLYNNSPEVAKQVLGNKSVWDKPQIIIDSLAPFGPNVFATNQADWPRHRRIVAPGFGGGLYPAVWNETVNTYYDCLATEKWESEDSFIMPNVVAITSKFALYLIAKSGFGIDLSWNESIGEKINGMTMPECFEVTSSSVVLLSMLPRWMFFLPLKALRRLRDARKALDLILRGIIDKRRAEGVVSTEDQRSKNIFSLLLKANDGEKGSKAALSDQELVSNVFLLLLAGHETTSRALAGTLGLLACHPTEQQKAYEEVMSVLKKGNDPTFDDFERLPFIQGCFSEGLRLFPSSPAMIRAPLSDTVLSIPSTNGEPLAIPVKADQLIWIDWIGVGRNPRVYAAPDSFMPSRWLDPTTEPLLNFSYGPRVCIGKRFALTESVGILCLLLRDHQIEPILKIGQTLQEWRTEWETNVDSNIGFGPKPFPLKMTRRQLA